MQSEYVNKIHCGNCIEVMKQFPTNSLDCIVTDPPYGIAFMGKQWDKALPDIEAFKQMYRVLKPGALAFVMSSPRQDVLWRMMQMLEGVGFQLRQSFISWIYKTGFPKAYDVSKGIDKRLGILKDREVIKERVLTGTAARTADDKGAGAFSPATSDGRLKDSKRLTYKDTIPASNLAKKWSGWKSITGLKPALECILMVNKPMSESTIVDNVLKHGTGAVNVDACRIPFKNVDDSRIGKEYYHKAKSNIVETNNQKGEVQKLHDSKGRFPANLLVSDKVIDSGKITKSKVDKRDEESSTGKSGIYHEGWKRKPNMCNDKGDQSRYFDLDQWWSNRCIYFDVPKPSKRERDKGLEGLKEKEVHRQGHGNKEEDDVTKRFRTKIRNIHPTVKPIKLMAYLIELGCSKEGIVLDPFVGSGTTCIAAKMLNRKFIGIELNEEYAKIASARLGNVKIAKYKSGKTIKVNKEVTKSTSISVPIGNKPKCEFKCKCGFRSNGVCYMKKDRRKRYCEGIKK